MTSLYSTHVEDDYDRWSSDGSVEVITSKMQNVALGTFDDPENNITEDWPDIEHNRIIPRVIIPEEIWSELSEIAMWQQTFIVPANVGGLLIGKSGKHIRELKLQWNAEISLNPCPNNRDILLLDVVCPLESSEFVIKWISDHTKLRRSRTAVGNPNKLKRLLPLGATSSVHIRCLYGLKEFFVTIKDKEYEAYLKMQQELDRDYGSITFPRSRLCDPVTVGTVAILPHQCGFARAIITKIISIIPQHALCFLLDHGTFAIVRISALQKIRAKYMKISFQAIHVSWAYALPLYNDIPDLHILRTFFSSNQILAYPVRMQTCCRGSVVFIDRISCDDNITTRFVDILAIACASGLYTLSLLCLQTRRQIWINHTKKPYYSCPYSIINYDPLIKYFPEDEYFNYELRQMGPESWYAKQDDKNRRKVASTNFISSNNNPSQPRLSGKSYLKQNRQSLTHYPARKNYYNKGEIQPGKKI